MVLDRDYPLRGRRDYLHSTTVMNDLLGLRAGAREGFDFRFDRRTARQVRLQDDPPARAEALVGSWRDALGSVFIVERDAPLERVEPYDEDGLAEQLAVDEACVSIPSGIVGYTVPEVLVAAFKALLRRGAAGPDARVAFVRLTCAGPLVLPERIVYARRIGGFYQGDLEHSGRRLGQIYFGEWR